MQFMQLIENYLLFPTWWLRLNVQLTAGFAACSLPPMNLCVRRSPQTVMMAMRLSVLGSLIDSRSQGTVPGQIIFFEKDQRSANITATHVAVVSTASLP
jgi:hypothetical protein